MTLSTHPLCIFVLALINPCSNAADLQHSGSRGERGRKRNIHINPTMFPLALIW